MKIEKAIKIIGDIRSTDNRNSPRRRKTTTRSEKIRKFVKIRGLKVKGFKQALKQFVTDFYGEYDDDEFAELFGDLRIIPAAFTIQCDGDGMLDTTIHVYEVEDSNQISKDRISYYGDLADREGPLITLHIVDRFGEEHVIENDLLQNFAFYPLYARHDREYAEEGTDEILRSVRSAKELPKGKRSLKWKAAYDALREMGVEI